MSNLPSLNYDTKLDIDDLKLDSQDREVQILERTKLLFGQNSGANLSYGIVDQLDPKDVISSDVNRPLLVKPTDVNPLRIDVEAGTAICPNGTIVKLESYVYNFELAATDVDDINVVFLENEIIPAGEFRISRYNTSGQVRRIQNPEILRVVTLTDYNNSSLFPLTRKENIVVIAVVKVIAGTTANELFIDYTNNDYSFNRPWFSVVDAAHRAARGSGVVTERNPHGYTFNDLSTGNIPFYSQVAPVGCILAKDKDLKGRVGYACVETIDPSRLLTDASGDITASSRFGGLGAKYFELAFFPTSVNSMHLQNHASRSLAFDWIPGTRLVVVPFSEIFTTSASIYYNRVNSLELSSFINGNKVTFGQPDQDNEFIVSGGLSYNSIVNQVVEFEGSGPIARNFKVYLNSNGDLIKFPQILLATTLLDNVGGEFVSLDVNQFGPAQLSVGMADALAGASLRVTVRLFGTNTQNVSITEDVTFDSSWLSPTLPANEDLTNLRKTNNVFNSLTGYQVIERSLDGSASKILIYAEIESGVAVGLNDLSLAADVNWDGLSVSDVIDSRKVIPFFPEGYKKKYEAIAVQDGSKDLIVTEEIASPSFNEVVAGYQEGSYASTFITFSNNVTIGDSIILSPTRTLVATSGTPNRTLGVFKIGANAQATRDDAILTINNTSFDSGFVAVAEGTNRIKITSLTQGSRGNGDITITTTVSLAITKDSDLENGYDTFGEAIIPHHSDRLKSTVPSPTAYDVFNIRNRYLSRAIPIDYSNDLRVLIHGIKVPYSGVQVRVRYAYETIDWSPWEVVTGSGPYFDISKSGQITKIQIAIFGECDGFSLYEG